MQTNRSVNSFANLSQNSSSRVPIPLFLKGGST